MSVSIRTGALSLTRTIDANYLGTGRDARRMLKASSLAAPSPQPGLRAVHRGRADPRRRGGRRRHPGPVDGALAELAYALDDVRLDGVVLFSNASATYLGDPHFTPLFDELQRRAAVAFVHPNPSPDPSAHTLGLPDSYIDFTADTTRAIARLYYSNTFARTPDVKYVFSHAGGTVPYLAGRFGIIDEMKRHTRSRGPRDRGRDIPPPALGYRTVLG